MTTKNKPPVSGAVVKIGGEGYELVLTTRATREIAKRYGGLEHLGTTLESSDDLDATLGEVIWLVTLLANQSVAIHNLTHKDNQREELTCEIVELLTVPADLAEYRGAITAALNHGMRRNIETEPADPKAEPPTQDT